MSASINIDDLFNQIDQVSEKLEAKNQGNSGKGGKKKVSFKNLDMTFIAGILGNYEMKLFVDSTGKLSEDIYIHTVKSSTAKVTVPCKGEGCTLCALQQKLEDMKNKAAWKFKPYKLNKFIFKVGDSQVSGLKAGTVYVAYADDNYFKPLIDSIRTNKKYFPNELGLMLHAKESSPGLVVNASKTGKKTSYNFNFISTLKINGVNEVEVFGNDHTYKLENLGYFRSNYIDATKLASAESILQKLIIATAEKSVSKDKDSTPEKETTSTTETPKAETSSEPVKTEDVPKEAPKEEVNSEPVVIVRDSKLLGEDGKPKCFSEFDPNSKACSTECQHKRECLMKAMELGKI